MKSIIASVFAATAVQVAAQAYSSAGFTVGPSTSYVYSYYDDCSTEAGGPSTETGTIVKTYCSECEEASAASFESAFRAAGGVVTTYTTVYSQFCPTGLEEKTYTVTESCTESTHGLPRPTGYVPQGFTVTTATCHVCGPKPVVATLTTPTPAPTAPAAAPAEQTPSSNSPSGGSSPASPAGGSAPESEGAPAGGSPASPGGSSPEGSPASPGSAPAGGAAAPAAPYGAPGRYAAAPTGAPASGSSGNSSAPITPFTGAASNISARMSFLWGFLGMLVWLCAF